jgi:phospholipase/carboxylesterase
MQEAVIRHMPAEGIAFVLPRAEGGSWYAARAVDPLTEATREEIARSLSGVAAVIRDLRAEAPGRPLLLAGFSQGACLAIEHAFSGEAPPDALAAMTGCRVGGTGDARPSRLPAGLPVWLTGARADSWIPVAALAEAVAELGTGGAALRADIFPDRPHAISGAEIAMLAAMLTDLAAGRAPGMGAER